MTTDAERFEKMTKLVNREYLITAIKSGKTQTALAKEIGCTRKTLRKALKYHKITLPYIKIHNDSLRESLSKIK